MLDAFKAYLNQTKIAQIEALGHKPTHEELERILSQYIRSEKVAIKDIKLRTFITEATAGTIWQRMCMTSLTGA